MARKDDNDDDDENDEAVDERLGKSALGRHAFESQMPSSLRTLLDNESSSNDLRFAIPALAHLLALDSNLDNAVLCHPSAVQVYKISGEGHHFCGYRNIQMLLLALGGTKNAIDPTADATMEGKTQQKKDRREELSKRKLRIPEIQDKIEAAWDAGINAHARAQTGGIKGTRKDIGTSEAEALLLHHDIPCTGHAFNGADACAQMFDLVERHFSISDSSSSYPQTASGKETTSASASTNSTDPPHTKFSDRPPLFLQRPRHSITVVGIERTKSGKRRLLTFDPAYAPSRVVKQVAATAEREAMTAQTVGSGGHTTTGETRKSNGELRKKLGWSAAWNAKRALWRYRKSEDALATWKAFEVLAVDDG